MPAEIVRLAPENWNVFRSVRLESLERAPDVFGTALHQEVDKPDSWWRERLASPDVGVYTARSAGDTVAMAGWMLPPSANTRHRAYIWGVYVRDGLRGGGVGRRLVAATLADAISRSEAIDLHVRTDNAAAVRLYEALGFRIVGTVPRSLKYAGTYADQHIMAYDPAIS